MRPILKSISIIIFLCFAAMMHGQSILPPVLDWKGESEKLIVSNSHPWVTPTEKSGFVRTPDYEETMAWLKKLAIASPLLSMVNIGKSVEGRDIFMVIASTDKVVTAKALRNSTKPLLLAQAGIHSGEIDGKDAGMMLLRDIAFGKKKSLLNGVNFLFIPILNVDGHERTSSFNRPNQRGPENMGWRTNAQNLNLNRDYVKLDTKEVQAVVKVMNDYDPLMYMDIHVTDGADYQYDITYGGHGQQGYSPNISKWLREFYKPNADKALQNYGHIPGPLMFAANDMDFSEGNVLAMGEPRFSDAYGDARHLASVLVENHSLKPFKQRVLGTYVLLESTLKLLATTGNALQEATASDKSLREPQVPLAYKVPQIKEAYSFENVNPGQNTPDKATPPDSLNLLGISSKMVTSEVTGRKYIQWLGTPITMTIPYFKSTEPINFVSRPKAYWVPAANDDVIARLKAHGVKMDVLTAPQEVEVEISKIDDFTVGRANGKTIPYEGHVMVTAKTTPEKRKVNYSKGSVRISTDQPLGHLVMLLLEPNSTDSFFSWGFFSQIFQRTEYIEAYVMEPTILKMLEESPELKAEFNQKKAQDAAFASNPNAIFSWFYSKTEYYDKRYLIYPVGREM